MDRIEIIEPSLLEDRWRLGLIDRWKRLLGIEVGWHYDLDIIWILRYLEGIGLKRGSLVLDAGAGNGLLQFILASLGYNVLSVDFAEREAPLAASRIFRIERRDGARSTTDNPYAGFIRHRRAGGMSAGRALKGLSSPGRALGAVSKAVWSRVDPALLREVFSRKRRSYGSLTYVKSDFTDMREFEDASIDCIVSVSAIEHNRVSDMKKSVDEFTRILKPGSAMLVTTSAARQDWYFKACEGWCLSYRTLSEVFSIGCCLSNFERYDEIFESIRGSQVLRRRVSRLYSTNGDNGLPWGVYDPKYQPVGVLKRAR
ncbi:MAG TPA: hypothetical protein DDW94_11000 [Deltaproteobacteria bacterium]|nr:MAG: hypothetical protein A2Z79_11380 [Deltaproteobacteria bacterium GWA2_55_82]OGQ63474.1 MAG: hypothetical protein A3I81_05565 [Deltaproteobacteria bacterium RIFCSPLOWO2_02_FULL_55_12]OIJ74855.1 MAG: hypothetical protein A2V21_311620 [Deltaproteobacteria bacterium GWC2_55_46]HBG47497.1 hypothetical protein [Deltaproteobacteria bacterium]HCY11513.1 hypothetical protein [Deltaproteobacteria bacterium]